MTRALRRAPALWLALGLTGGIAISPGLAAIASVGGWAAGALVAVAVLLRRWPCWALPLLCAAAASAGSWLDHLQREAYEQAVAELFPDGSQVRELHLIGELLHPPQSDDGGEVILWLHGAPEDRWRQGGRRYTLLLRVGEGTAAAGGRAEDMPVGVRVRLWCRLRAPQQGSRLRVRPYHGLGFVKSEKLLERSEQAGPRRPIAALREMARRRLDAVLPADAPGRPLLHAMLLGSRGIPTGQQRLLRDAGMLHLVAISGLHVAILVSLLCLITARTGFAPWLQTLLLLSLLALYAPAVGARPSVLRAVTMAGIVTVGRCCGREGMSLNNLAMIASLLAIADPSLVRHPAFQLTFLATLGILLLPRQIAAVLPLPPRLALAPAVSVSAYLATAPAVAWHFGRLAPVGVATNLTALPLCAVALASGYAAMWIEPIPWLGAALGSVAAWSAGALLEVAGLAAAWDPGSLAVARPTPVLLVAYYVALSVRAVGGVGGVGVMVTLLALALHLGPPPGGDGGLEATALDVGQGLSVAVRSPRGAWIVVDAGGHRRPAADPGQRVVVPHLLARGARRVETLILTHGHVDHAGGAFALLRDIEVGQLWIGPGYHRSRRLLALAGLARDSGAAVVMAEAGRSDRVGALPVRVVAPTRAAAAYAENDASLVVILGASPHRILVPGDLEREGEEALCRSSTDLRSELLLVSHHGSRHGSTEGFLARVRPLRAIVSAGRGNAFGHPHGEVLRRFRARRVPLLRTDVQGAVTLHGSPTGWAPGPWLTRRGAEPG